MIYLDASVIVSALTREQQSVVIRAWLQDQSSSQLLLSSWTLLETASTISKKQRRGDLTTPQHQLALQLLDAVTNLNWSVLDTVPADFSVARTWVSEPTLALRGGDALHLAIARRRELAVATLDNGMIKVARQLGIPCAAMPE